MPLQIQRLLRDCTGAGTWAYDAGDSPWTQEVTVSFDGCSMDEWNVGGTPEHPTLYVYIGDPDSWDLYTLTRNAVTARTPAEGTPTLSATAEFGTSSNGSIVSHCAASVVRQSLSVAV
ncbi:hypothetical protein ACFV9O_39940, partial [Streptomyces sp. NPDC059909]